MGLFEDRPIAKKPARLGLMVLGIFAGLFVLFALFLPIESASVAQGFVVVESSRKTVQHLEGGIVKKLNVSEGTFVKKGDILVELSDTQARASYDLLHQQAMTLLGNEARLLAMVTNANEIKWPDDFKKYADQEVVKKIMYLQTNLFISDTNSLKGQIEILESKIKQSKDEINALQEQIGSKKQQLGFIEEEIKAVSYLEQRKLIEKPRLWSLQREQARLRGDIATAEQDIAKANEGIGETRQRIITIKDSTQKDNLKELNDIQSKLTEILERRKNAKDIFDRTYIRSTQAGTVVNLQQHTLGGVIRPGEPILDIVPKQDELIVEAHINPIDIAFVHVGLTAKIQLIALNQRITPSVEGTVMTVSADTLQNQQTGQRYYSVRIKVDKDQLNNIKNAVLYPGMPVNVLIVTGKRSLFYYMISPLLDGFKKAFRER